MSVCVCKFARFQHVLERVSVCECLSVSVCVCE